MIAILSGLALQELERGGRARAFEIRSFRDLFEASRATYDEALDGRLAAAVGRPDADLQWSALDALNADLRRVLIALHEEAERREDRALDRAIIALYERMAHERRLELPTALGA